MSSPALPVTGFRPRCRVTALQANGTSAFVSDEEVAPHAPRYGGLELFSVWKAALPLELPLREAEGAGSEVHVSLVRFLPGQSAGKPFASCHWHDTVDVQILIEGELVQRLDDGSEVTMRPGDVIVQAGTSHAWEARGDEGALLAIVMHSAQRTGDSPPPETHISRVIGSSRADGTASG
jgi:quercetin dioxygenase-like cupin family protein